jgi:hypothetical protein
MGIGGSSLDGARGGLLGSSLVLEPTDDEAALNAAHQTALFGGAVPKYAHSGRRLLVAGS